MTTAQHTLGGRRRALHHALALSAALALPTLARSQAAADPAMAFPRESLALFLKGDVDKFWERASPSLRQVTGSPAALREQTAEYRTMGPETAMLSEQVFDHPEGGGARVYVRGARHQHIGEIFWIVVFVPARRQVEMIQPQPRLTIRTLFPQVRLPPG